MIKCQGFMEKSYIKKTTYLEKQYKWVIGYSFYKHSKFLNQEKL